MTYCFAFKANPDGVAIIADTRITFFDPDGSSSYKDGELKIICPRRDYMLAVAGNVDQIRRLIVPVIERLQMCEPSKLHEAFKRQLASQMVVLWNEGYFCKTFLPSISVIYADIRKHRSKSMTRLASYDLGVVRDKPAIGQKNGKKVEWTSIGWTPEGRKFLNEQAIDALSELESRSLKIRDFTDEEKSLMQSSRGLSVGVLDSGGPRDSTFRKVLRKHCAELPVKPGGVPVEPMLIFGAAALKSIEAAMLEARSIGFSHSHWVGNNWSLATLTTKYGFFVHADDVVKSIV